jgi:hypothetical protein
LDPPPPQPTAQEKKEKQDRGSFAFLLTSRQIFLETAHLPFSLHTIYSFNLWDMSICLRRFSEEQREAIRTLKIG